MIKAVLFDLDGTILPMDEKMFTKSYFRRMAAKLAPFGYDAKNLVDSVWKGTAAMIKNDGSNTNEDVFWRCFTEIYGEDAINHKTVFNEYYEIEFQEVANDCGFNPKAKETIETLKTMNLKIVLATNPVFPVIATVSKINWAGLEPSDFEFYTTYENSCFCKPNPKYYEFIAERLGVCPEECLMVGNNVSEDMVASSIGMKIFLLSDCLINKYNKDISSYQSGSFDKLMDYVIKII